MIPVRTGSSKKVWISPNCLGTSKLEGISKAKNLEIQNLGRQYEDDDITRGPLKGQIGITEAPHDYGPKYACIPLNLP